MARHPEVFVRDLSMAEGQRLQKITRTAKDPVKLRWAIVAAQVVRQLGDPRPADASTTQKLAAYRNLAPRWHDWGEVRVVCRALAAAMVEVEV